MLKVKAIKGKMSCAEIKMIEDNQESHRMSILIRHATGNKIIKMQRKMTEIK